MPQLVVCYGPEGDVVTVAGNENLVQEFHTALFTSAALSQEAPHDCDHHTWCEWVEAVVVDDEGVNLASGGGGCPCQGGSDLPCPQSLDDQVLLGCV